MLFMDFVICHYHEIGLKGKNRKFFEEKLVANIKKVLPRDYFSWIKRISGRILIKLTEKGREKEEEISLKLKKVFGLVNFSFAKRGESEIESIKKEALEILKAKKFKSFKIAAKRSDKKFPLTSQEINERVGEYILERFKIKDSKLKIQVDLENPDITLFIEVVGKQTFFYTEKVSGPGGLPVTTGGKAVALLSGGIDSPVASYFLMKRGVKIIFVHFHAYPYTKKASITKAKKIVQVFQEYQQGGAKLYLVPFGEIQKEIVLKAPAKLRIIFYRRAMIKLAERIAKKEKAQALVTGESVGQVASQTLENIKVIDEAVKLPIFRPLIGFDKEEIIQKAKEIGTFDLSILPAEDCCSRFLPKHPETRAKLKEVQQIEKKVPLKTLIEKALFQTKIILLSED